MPKQNGALKFLGSLGDITYYKAKDGYFIKQKTNLRKRIKTDPKFQRTRENAAEFATAARAGKLLRTTFRSMFRGIADHRMVSRLTKKMIGVLQADLVSDRGLRNITKGDTLLLKDFEFNLENSLNGTLIVKWLPVVDRVTGQVSASIPSFVPCKLIAAPDGATHFMIVSGTAAINFDSRNTDADLKETELMPLGDDPLNAIKLQHAIMPNSKDPIFLLLGIRFCQVINGKQYPLKNGAFNAAAIIAVSAN